MVWPPIGGSVEMMAVNRDTFNVEVVLVLPNRFKSTFKCVKYYEIKLFLVENH